MYDMIIMKENLGKLLKKVPKNLGFNPEKLDENGYL